MVCGWFGSGSAGYEGEIRMRSGSFVTSQTCMDNFGVRADKVRVDLGQEVWLVFLDGPQAKEKCVQVFGALQERPHFVAAVQVFRVRHEIFEFVDQLIGGEIFKDPNERFVGFDATSRNRG